MPQLQWQQVAAPNTAGAADGFNQFSQLLGGALGSLKTGVTGFDNAKSDLINNQLALALAQQPGVDATRAAVASGRVGGIDLTDPNVVRRLSSANLQAISPETLIKQATDKVALDQKQSDFNQNQALDAQSALIGQARGARAQGNLPLAQQLEGQIDWSKTGFKNAEDFYANDQRTDQNRISNSKSQFDLDNQKTAYTEGRHATQAAEAIARASVNPSDINHFTDNWRDPTTGEPLNANEAGLARSKALELMKQSDTTGGGGFNGPAVTNPDSVAGGYGTFVTNAKFDKPANEYTLGELQDNVQPKLIQATRGKFGDPNTGSSASGMFQITSDTMKQFAPQVLGSNWRDYKFTPMVQEAIANKIYDSVRDSKGNIDPKALMGRWASLSPDQAQQIASQNLPWSQARGVIAHGEVGADPLQMAATGSMVDTGIKDTLMQTMANSGMAGFQKAWNDPSDARSVAANLKKTDFTGKNVDAGQLETHISKIVSEARDQGVNLSPAIAGEILKQSTGGQGALHRVYDSVLGGFDPSNLGDGQTINKAKVTDLINQYKTGKLHQDLGTFAQLQTAQAPILLADQRYQEALGLFNDAMKKSQTKEGVAPGQIEQYRQRMIQAGLDREQAYMSAAKVVPKEMFGVGKYQSPADKSKVQAALDAAAAAKYGGPNFVGAY